MIPRPMLLLGSSTRHWSWTKARGEYTVADIGLAEQGALRVDWARSRMPVLRALKEQGEIEKPLAGMRVAGCLHVTKETAVLIQGTIAAAGAEISCRDAIHFYSR